MSQLFNRRRVVSLVGGTGLVGGLGLLTSCGTGIENSNSGTNNTSLDSSCSLPSATSNNNGSAVDSIASDLLQTTPANQAATYRNVNKIYPNRVIAKSSSPSPLPLHSKSLCGLQYSHGINDYSLSQYFKRNRTAGLLVLKNGEIALELYAMGNSPSSRWTSFSVAKSLTSTLVGVALQEGLITNIDNNVQFYLPSFAGSAYGQNTIRQLLCMTSGIAWNEDSATTRPGTLGGLFAAARTMNSNNVLNFMRRCVRANPAGSLFRYSTGETYLLGAIVAAATGRKLSTYFAEKIAKPMGMETDGYWILDSPNGLEMGGNNFSATLRDYARFGQFFLRDGTAGYPRVLPLGWLDQASQPGVAATAHGSLPILNYPLGYGYQWWSFPKGESAINKNLAIHEGAFTAQGIYGQFIYINPIENAVVVVWSAWPKNWDSQREFEAYSMIAAALSALR